MSSEPEKNPPAPRVSRRTIWIGGAAAALLAILGTAYWMLRMPEIRVDWFEYQADQEGNVKIDILFGIVNRAVFDVELGAVDIRLDVDGFELYRNRINRTIPLPNHESVPFPVTLHIPDEIGDRFYSSSLRSATDPDQLRQRQIPYDLQIVIQMSSPLSREFKVRYQGTFPAFRVPEIEPVPGGFQIRQFSLSNPLLTLPVQVYNPNEFDIDVKDLEFDVSIYGRQVSHVKPDQTIRLEAGKSDVIRFDFNVETMKLGFGGLATLFRGYVDLNLQGAFTAGTPFGNFPIRFNKDARLQMTR